MSFEVRLVFVGDGKKPQRARGVLDVQSSKLRISFLGIRASQEEVYEFRLYRGKRFLLPLRSWLSGSFGAAMPVVANNVSTRVLSPARARLSIDPPWPFDFTLHVYGAEGLVRTTLETFVG